MERPILPAPLECPLEARVLGLLSARVGHTRAQSCSPTPLSGPVPPALGISSESWQADRAWGWGCDPVYSQGGAAASPGQQVWAGPEGSRAGAGAGQVEGRAEMPQP